MTFIAVIFKIVQVPLFSRFVVLAAIAFAIASMVRRDEDIGGFLLYFYFWIFATPLVFASDIVMHPQAFLRADRHDAFHLALILATFPRLIAFVVATVMAVMLLFRREWDWVERVQLALSVCVIISLLSLAINWKCFPNSLRSNAIRWISLLLWTIYFFVSKRVNHVFRTRDWATGRS